MTKERTERDGRPVRFSRTGPSGHIEVEVSATCDPASGTLLIQLTVPAHMAELGFQSRLDFGVLVLCMAWGMWAFGGQMGWSSLEQSTAAARCITGVLEMWLHENGWNPDQSE